MRIKTSIYLLLWITINLKITNAKDNDVSDTDDSDSVTIEADTLPVDQKSARKSRHVAYVRGNWLDALGEGNPCLSSTGVLGACISFRKCYPFIRKQQSKTTVSAYNSWYIGNFDPCSYFESNGRQLFGICCTNPQTPSQSENSDEIENEDNNEIDDTKKNGSTQKWPPPLPTHPPFTTHPPRVTQKTTISTFQWPPPIPTHPPDHAAPTHPPGHNDHRTTTPNPWWTPSTTTQTPWWEPSTTTTTKPWWTSTTTTQNPWWPPQTTTSTTPKPWWTTTTTPNPWWTPSTTTPTTTRRTTTVAARPVWPPPIPTHPPAHQPEAPIEAVEESENFQGACGVKNGARDQERIVGGQNANPNEFPWIVVLFNNGRQFCGGSLIDNMHVLTAAHCVAQMTSWDVARITAHLGDHDIRNPHEVRHTTRRVKRVVRHKGFEFSALHNDVAVLTLDQPVTFTRSISPICLPVANTAKSYRGQLATVAGWGSLRENGPQPSVLQKVTIPVWSNDDCARKYGGAAPAGIISTMLCAGQIARDSCSGDSGGPLMLNDGGGWTQVGIVSWGIGCGKGQYPGVYTRVSSYMPWITKNLHLK